MLTLSFILRGLIIGFIASIPIGPVAMFVVQKSVSQGFKGGISCGFGCMITDFIYAFISVFALSWISELIDAHTDIIKVCGGILIIIIGIIMLFQKDIRQTNDEGMIVSLSKFSPTSTAKAASMGLSNPGALAVMLSLFAFFNLDTSIVEGKMEQFAVSILVVLAVSLGSGLYWLGFSKIASKFQKRLKMESMLLFNKIVGAVVIIFGTYFIITGLHLA